MLIYSQQSVNLQSTKCLLYNYGNISWLLFLYFVSPQNVSLSGSLSFLKIFRQYPIQHTPCNPTIFQTIIICLTSFEFYQKLVCTNNTNTYNTMLCECMYSINTLFCTTSLLYMYISYLKSSLINPSLN